jgi:putative flippase GtrA
MIRGFRIHRPAAPLHEGRAGILPRWLFESPAVERLLRFATTGAISAASQLALLWILLDVDLRNSLANLLSFLAGAQVNFVLSLRFTWRDRSSAAPIAATWLRFMCAVSCTALLNLAVFAVADLFVPSILAAAVALGVIALANFVIADRAIFAAAAASAVAVTQVHPIETQES